MIRCSPRFARKLQLAQRIPLAAWRTRTARPVFGDDPKTSALARTCKADELDKLDVVDSIFFCSSGRVNPALTIIANALRVGDHLLERMDAATTSTAQHGQRAPALAAALSSPWTCVPPLKCLR